MSKIHEMSKAELASAAIDAGLALKRVRPYLNAPEAYTQAEREALNTEVGTVLKVLMPETEPTRAPEAT